MGRVTTADAAASDGVERVILIDRDEVRAAEVAAGARERRGARAGRGRGGHCCAAITGADAVVNAASHRLNLPVMRACLEAGAHYTDLGGLYYYAIEQYELDEDFRARRALGRDLDGRRAGHHQHARGGGRRRARHGRVDRGASTPCVAGLPYDPDAPFVPPYAADTLIDEFTRPAPMFIDGREQLMPAAGGARTYHLPEGDVECVYTIHSEPATLPRSYADRGIRTVEWRLGLPPAHTAAAARARGLGHGLDRPGATWTDRT